MSYLNIDRATTEIYKNDSYEYSVGLRWLKGGGGGGGGGGELYELNLEKRNLVLIGKTSE